MTIRDFVATDLAGHDVHFSMPLVFIHGYDKGADPSKRRQQREIAEAMGISEAAVKARVFRATQLLRKKLTQMGITP